MSLYLSRLTIARNPAASAIRALIDPHPAAQPGGLRDPAQGRIMDAHHRLLWAVFADSPDRRRDFLWRAEGDGRFHVLSARPPAADGAGLFEPPEVKSFDPDLRPGDRLAFLLRANATRTRINPAAPEARGYRVDVVMDAIHHLPSGQISDARRLARNGAAEGAGRGWLEDRGRQAGFTVDRMAVTGYAVVPLPVDTNAQRGDTGSTRADATTKRQTAGTRRRQPQFGVLDMTGEIRVTEPAALIARISDGFGRARAFGCGLMLIRRA